MGALDRYLADRPGPWTVLHSDLRLDNLLFGRPRVTVVDWHTVKVGPGLSDVSYFIGSSLAPEVRRDFECELVRAYHRHLASGGRGPGVGGMLAGLPPLQPGWPGDGDRGLDAGAACRRGAGAVGLTMVSRHGCQALDLGAEEFLPA